MYWPATALTGGGQPLQLDNEENLNESKRGVVSVEVVQLRNSEIANRVQLKYVLNIFLLFLIMLFSV